MRVLIKLGVSERLAIACGITNKGPWRSAKTKGILIVISNAISNTFLARQGLLSLRDRLQNYLRFVFKIACFLRFFESNLA